MPMMAPAKVRISPKAVRTVGSMTPVGGTMKAAMRRMTPKITSRTEIRSWDFILLKELKALCAIKELKN